MIKPGEIQGIAGKQKLRDTQIEKDYVIAWILLGISESEYLKPVLAFKGGTAIRKFHIKDYRLSEDLDFTFIEGTMDTNILKNKFNNVLDWIKEESRLNLELRDETLNKKGNFNFYIGYVGPLGGNIKKKDIKVDICDNKKMCNITLNLESMNEYSDLTVSYKIRCYSINEIISEKLRSLIQRTIPRDLYDLWYFFFNAKKNILDYASDFQEKTIFKSLEPNKFLVTVNDKKSKFSSNWKKNLEMQIKEVPDFDFVWRELSKHFKKLDKYLNT